MSDGIIQLSALCAMLPGAQLFGAGGTAVSAVSTDARTVGSGELFIGLKGARFDGTDFAAQAAQRGAAAVMASRHLPDVPVPQIVVDDVARAFCESAAAWRQQFRIPVISVSGSNGKTTTTTLLGEIMKYHSKCGTEPLTEDVFVVGNIGTPYTLSADKTSGKSVTVAEISSFQLETIHSFRPRVSAITNITPDHLNRHHTMEEYIRVKERIAENQTGEDACVLNYEDEVLRAFGQDLHVPVLFFSSRRMLEEGLCLNGDMIEYHHEGTVTEIVSRKEMHLPGLHNAENVMTAAGMALCFGVPAGEIADVCRSFRAVEHRIEYVAEKGGVVYYNDSKGTNPDAAIKAVEAMDRPTVLLAGGYDKNSTYEEWIATFPGRVKALVLIGQTKGKIAEAAARCGFEPVYTADTFEEAFDRCVKEAASGDAVLLSPACASWDMFPNYEERGRLFKEMVNKLP